jgi:hypothetical protein
MLRILIAFAMTLAAARQPNVTASEAKSQAAFDVTVWDFDGSAGYTHVYHLTPKALTVSLENDFGQPPKELCTLQLSPSVAAAWSDFLATFPLERLSDNYVDAAIEDGVQLRFAIRRGSWPRRLIRVDNMSQLDLAVLCDRLDALVSDSCFQRRLRMPRK